jgi:peptidyl-prolyl cis-trans isomerase B (cyclophilin B)
MLKTLRYTLWAMLLAPALALAGTLVQMDTNIGTMVIELNNEKAPKTVENFLQYVREGFYEGTLFHRVIDNFMIQGGGFSEDFQPKETHSPIENEADNGLKNARGTIAMARTSDPHSATSQFFINVKDNEFLDYPGQDGWGYTVFGKVIEGMDVVDKISRLPTGTGGPNNLFSDVPETPVIIEKVTIVSE